MITFFCIKMMSLYAKFQPCSFKTEGVVRGCTVKMQNFIFSFF